MADSLWGQALEDVQSAIRGLALLGLQDEHVVVLHVPSDSKKYVPGLPAILITPFGSEDLPRSEGTMSRDQWQLPILVGILDAANQVNTLATLDARLLWRETIIDHFVFNRDAFPSVTNMSDVYVDPQPAVDISAWFERQIFASAIVVRALIRKPRRV